MKLYRRAWVIIALISVITVSFWVQSRYPDLNGKAVLAEAASIEDPVAVNPIIKVKPTDPLHLKITYSTINWLDNNKKGMTFGVVIAGCFFALFPLLRLRPRRKKIPNLMTGVLLGTPLGLCVNCSAPVFKSVLQSRRLETAFAMMFSSPTLNFVVLTMVFSLFPWHLALLKLAFTAVVIFAVVPLLSTLLARYPIKDWNRATGDAAPCESEAQQAKYLILAQESWLQAMVQGIIDSGKGIFAIAVRTVPLMFVAGLLGAVLSYLIPFSFFSDQPSTMGLLVVAMVSTLLPIPIAVDVIISNAFYTQGLPISIIAMMLCSLGIYSFYSFTVVWSSASRQWAVGLLASCMLLTFLVGLTADKLHYWAFIKPNMDYYASSLTARDEPHKIAATATATSENTATTIASRPAPETLVTRYENLSVLSRDFTATKTSPHNMPFEFIEGPEKGIHNGFQYSIRDFTDPFWIGRGTAAGDINRDGWVDLVLGSHQGPVVYLNLGGNFQEVFKPTRMENSRFNTYAVALMDLNRDGWLDLFFTTYDAGNFLVLNEQGVLRFEHPVPVPNNEALLTVSPGFADMDGNGYLDLINGNMALGVVTGSHHLPGYRTNSIVFNQDLLFRNVPLSNESGETMSTLVADINDDQRTDIYLSNDFIVPDRILLGTGSGFKEVNQTDSFAAATPVFSMSTDIGDVNNDLIPDLLIMGTIMKQDDTGTDVIDGKAPEQYMQPNWQADTCHLIKSASHREHCLLIREKSRLVELENQRNLQLADCERLSDHSRLQQECLLTAMWFLITNNFSESNRDDAFNCETRFGSDAVLFKVCQILQDRQRRYTQTELQDSLEQIDNNYLYIGAKITAGPEQGKVRFTDINKLTGDDRAFHHPGGWTWNAKFIDLDNDGWQDILNADGAIREHDYGWNVLMHNQQGLHFEQKQFSWGLTYPFSLFSFVAIDYDRDGDLDIIGNSSEGPVQIYENHIGQTNHSISFELSDHTGGNTQAIGANLTIEYLDQNHELQRQRRWIKASGGYMSFDPAMAWFGLGKASSVKKVSIAWPDGVRQTLDFDFTVGKSYRIVRE